MRKRRWPLWRRREEGISEEISASNVMIKQFVGYSGHILVKVIGVVIYTTFSARCVQEWTMR